MKNIALLGATGSIGKSTIEVIEQYKEQFNLYAVTCNKNTVVLDSILSRFAPRFALISDKERCHYYKSTYSGKTEILCGNDAMSRIIASEDIDLFVNAISGFAGTLPTLEILKRKKRIALANKESVVVFGNLITKEQYKYIIPVDSEHNAIYQCLSGERPDNIKRIILTASGGPFFKRQNLNGIKVDEALNHPTWSMGRKITVDSATMINKGYEIIEAHHLFDLPIDKIDVLIHPQSIIHSLVAFKDNSVKALLSIPDMKLPIEYALFEGERCNSVISELKLEEIGHLDFYKPNETVFKGLLIARESAKTGGTLPAVLNAADEAAVERFLKGDIEFLDIIKIVEKTINAHAVVKNPSIYDIIEANNWAYNFAEGVIL